MSPFMLAGCSDDASEGPAEMVELITGAQLGDFTTFDPYFVLAFDRLQHFQIYDPLVRIGAEQGTYSPCLATAWTMAPDGLSLTLTLREDVKFHSGASMAAADVVANIERARDTTVGHTLSGGAAVIKGVSAVDAKTVRIEYNRPIPEGVALDLMASLFIIEPAAVPNVKTSPSGTGPYKFVSFKPGEQLKLEANPNYWQPGLPKTKTIIIKTFTDASSMVLNLKGKEVDWVLGLDYNQVDALAREGFTVRQETSLGGYWTLLLNVRRPVFSDKRVRQAISFALDREKVVKAVFANQATATSTPFYSKSLAVYQAADVNRYAFNLDRAKSLLESAGVTNLQFEAMWLSSLPQAGPILEILQADLAKIGVKVDIKTFPAAQGQERYTKADFDCFLSALAVPARDPNYVYTLPPMLPTAANRLGYVDPRYQQLATAAASELDSSKRQTMYGQLRDILVDEQIVVPIASRPVLYAFQSSVSGFDSAVGDLAILSGLSKTK
ncbi:ABC transporter substrate-binding protein [Dactylosporangium sp. NPDC050688]|uniref:ABC transporter substrate-binding protein n=1 Tax=Dactylosporangium sp. NPDC050688 TaxID=3157217 RepID=UPI0033F23E13